jgi:acetolactate synthase-1/2/3 large subunit
MISEQDRERIPQERKGQTMTRDVNTVAELIVARLEVEGVDYIFGIPGEENIPLVGASLARPSVSSLVTTVDTRC